MRYFGPLMIAASLAFSAAPALAQNTSNSGNANAQNQSGAAQQNGASAQQQLVQGLRKAGFTHVRVEPEVFVIHAMNAQNEPVLMRVGPDSMESVTAVKSGNHGGSGQQHASGNGTNATNE